MKAIVVAGILAVAGVASSASAYNIQCRWVTVGGVPLVTTVIPTAADGFQTLDLSAIPAGTVIRIRKQFGVFDDAGGAAPAGGFIGLNVGTLMVPGGYNATRTPGRLAPFNFAPVNPGNGLPTTDPFTSLTSLDNTLGSQSPVWGIDTANNLPLPQPGPTIRGRNTFVSIFEFSITAGSANTDGFVMMNGNQILASGWGTVGVPNPPSDADGDGVLDTNGAVTYAPQTIAPVPGGNGWKLHLLVPAPGTAALLGLGGLVAARRRRA